MGKRPKVEIDTAAQAAAQQAQVGAIQAQTKAVEDQTIASNKAAEARRVIDEQAAAQQAAAAKAAAEAAMQQRNLAANMGTDLTNQNKGTVIAGGSADVVDAATPDAGKKKRRQGGSLSSQLGVNV